MIELLKGQGWKGLLLHIFLVTVLAIGLVYYYFEVHLLGVTQHGETITVPNIEGMSQSEALEFLSSRNLRLDVMDSAYSPDYKPLTVMFQHPEANSKVKENRKIYVTIRTTKPPKVSMPDLIDASFKNAQMVLNSFDLEVGDVHYVSHSTRGLVLSQRFKGQEIKPGTELKKGSKIDLTVSDGVGQLKISIPNLVGMDIDEAQLLISGLGLRIGTRISDPSSLEPSGTIIKQKPEFSPSDSIRSAQEIDVWVSDM